MSIEILYKKDDGFAPFLQAVAGKRVAILYDVNTAPYTEQIREQIACFKQHRDVIFRVSCGVSI